MRMKSQYLVGADSLLEDVIQVHQLLGHHLRVLRPDQVLDTLNKDTTRRWTHSLGADQVSDTLVGPDQVFDTLVGCARHRNADFDTLAREALSN